jgi:hypothetical protein
MRRIALSVVIVSLVAAACGDDDARPITTTSPESSTTTAPGSTTAVTTSTVAETTTTTGPTGFEVVSEDGQVTLDVPFEALPEDPGISITVLPPEEYPLELAGAAQNPGTVLYRLSPDPLEFDQPVTVTRSIPASNFEGLPPNGIPLIRVLVYTPGGGYEPLNGATIVREGDEIRVSGDLTHFSVLLGVYERQYAEAIFSPNLGAEVQMGQSYQVQLSYGDQDGNPLQGPGGEVASGYTDSEHVVFDPSDPVLHFLCNEEGPARVAARFDVALPSGDEVEEGAFGIRTTPILAGDNPVFPATRFEIATSIDCVTEVEQPSSDALTGTIQAATDHPGGTDHGAAAFDFAGGASAIVLKVDVAGGIENLRIAHVHDTNQNGLIDAGDRMFSPRGPEIVNGDECFILPVNAFGEYIFLMLVADEFDDVGSGPASIPIETAFEVLQGAYRGSGSFQEAVRVPMLGDIPFLGRVFQEESTVTEETDLVILVHANIVEGVE